MAQTTPRLSPRMPSFELLLVSLGFFMCHICWPDAEQFSVWCTLISLDYWAKIDQTMCGKLSSLLVDHYQYFLFYKNTYSPNIIWIFVFVSNRVDIVYRESIGIFLGSRLAWFRKYGWTFYEHVGWTLLQLRMCVFSRRSVGVQYRRWLLKARCCFGFCSGSLKRLRIRAYMSVIVKIIRTKICSFAESDKFNLLVRFR